MTTPPATVRSPAFTVAGIAVRTCNRDEMNPDTARLGELWNRFFTQSWERKLPARGDDGRIFGVYSSYASNEHGAFDVTAGVAVAATDLAQVAATGAARVNVEAGEYLVFTGEGEMPHMVIGTWERIWRYFAAHPQVQRRFGTDFEAYEGPDKVAIYIGVR